MRKEVLQKFIDENGNYLVGNRYVEGSGAAAGHNEWHAMFLAPNTTRDLWGKKIGEMPYDTVIEFADREILTNIHLGKSYSPFQYGIRYKDFIDIEKVTCNANELINKCYSEDIKDYHKVIELMKSLALTDLSTKIREL